MNNLTKTPPKLPALPKLPCAFKYPSEDECLVRRLGSAVLAAWGALPVELQERILQEATDAWDREYRVPQLRQKLEKFIRGHPARVV